MSETFLPGSYHPLATPRPKHEVSWIFPRPVGDILLAAVSGLLLGLAFLFPEGSPLGWVALVPLFVTLRERDARGNFFMGWIAGTIWFLVACHWLRYVTWVGWITMPLAEGILLGFWMAIAGRFHARWRFFLLPLLWVAAEMVRSKGPLGFSWNLMGHLSPEVFLPMAEVWGVYGLSFVFLAVNTVAAALLVRTREQEDWLKMPDGAGTFVFLPVIWLGIAAYVLWIAPSPVSQGYVRVGAVQGNFEQSLKWTVPVKDAVERYLRLSDQLVEETRPELLVWPECALPLPLSSDPGLVHYLKVKTTDWKVPLLAGILDIDFRRNLGLPEEKKAGWDQLPLYNSAYFLDPDRLALANVPETPEALSGFLRGEFREESGGERLFPSAHAGTAEVGPEAVQVYDKARLLQFGEYVPFSHLLPFVQRFVETRGGGAFSGGQPGKVLQTPWGEVGMLICFESTFSGLARKAAMNGAEMLFVLTNDAWFLQSAATRQHALQSRFRAIETGRAVVRVANTGLTRVYLPNGEVQGSLPVWQEGAETFQVPLYNHLTFQFRVGDFFAWLCLFCLGFSLLLPRRSPYSQGDGISEDSPPDAHPESETGPHPA